MDESIQEPATAELLRIERLIQEFKEKFAAGTSDADNFITISQIELLWSELQNNTNNIYSDMIRKMMSEVNESDLIRKKKRLPAQRSECSTS
jgi:Ca2+-binding EF-hand superfamily protein